MDQTREKITTEETPEGDWPTLSHRAIRAEVIKEQNERDKVHMSDLVSDDPEKRKRINDVLRDIHLVPSMRRQWRPMRVREGGVNAALPNDEYPHALKHVDCGRVGWYSKYPLEEGVTKLDAGPFIFPNGTKPKNGDEFICGSCGHPVAFHPSYIVMANDDNKAQSERDKILSLVDSVGLEERERLDDELRDIQSMGKSDKERKQ